MKQPLGGRVLALLAAAALGLIISPSHWPRSPSALAQSGICTPSFTKSTESPYSIGFGADPSAIATADFNGDGHADLAVMAVDELAIDEAVLPPAEAMHMAVLVVALVPILLLNLFLQRYFTRGVLSGVING